MSIPRTSLAGCPVRCKKNMNQRCPGEHGDFECELIPDEYGVMLPNDSVKTFCCADHKSTPPTKPTIVTKIPAPYAPQHSAHAPVVPNSSLTKCQHTCRKDLDEKCPGKNGDFDCKLIPDEYGGYLTPFDLSKTYCCDDYTEPNNTPSIPTGGGRKSLEGCNSNTCVKNMNELCPGRDAEHPNEFPCELISDEYAYVDGKGTKVFCCDDYKPSTSPSTKKPANKPLTISPIEPIGPIIPATLLPVVQPTTKTPAKPTTKTPVKPVPATISPSPSKKNCGTGCRYNANPPEFCLDQTLCGKDECCDDHLGPPVQGGPVSIKFTNTFMEPKTIYIRYTHGNGTTVNGKSLLSQDDKTLQNFNKPETPYEFELQPNENIELKINGQGGQMISAVAWVGLSEKLDWRGEAANDNICSLFEWTVDQGHVSYDISAVEGLCTSWDVKWQSLESSENPPESETSLKCNIPLKNGEKYIKSDKWIYHDDDNKFSGYTVTDLASCPVYQPKGLKSTTPETRNKKIACHNWYDENSYKDGYCKRLYDNDCQAYCWAFDEMLCPEGQNCSYNEDGNPTYIDEDGKTHIAHKTVDGAPTNPNVTRGKGGTLTVSFGPLNQVETFTSKPINHEKSSNIINKYKYTIIALIICALLYALFEFCRPRKR
jgi:hypothetical protein